MSKLTFGKKPVTENAVQSKTATSFKFGAGKGNAETPSGEDAKRDNPLSAALSKAKVETHTNHAMPTTTLKAALEQKSATPPPKTEIAGITQIASENERYVLDAEATDLLPQEVLETFAIKMQYLLDTMATPELQNAMYAVLEYTQENPHLKDILRPADIATMVKACRASYGMTVVAKTTNKTKRVTKVKVDAELLNELADLDLSL